MDQQGIIAHLSVRAGVAVVNGLLYAVGGHNTNIGSLGTLEAYDPVSDTWTTKASPEGL